MKKTFERLRRERHWDESRWGNILDNIRKRLEKRLPEGTEPTLTKFQKKVIDDPGFWRDWDSPEDVRHLMIQGATSAGKTLVSELGIIDTLNQDKNAIVLVPLKAMVHERMTQFKTDMGHGLPDYDITVFGSSGDYVDNDERLINGDYRVAIIVYEKFFAMLSQGYAKIMDLCGLLVVDELSMLSSEQRGPKLEMALEVVRRKFPETRIMCLATCDCSTEKICQWLDIKAPIISTARPVALEEHILELKGTGMCRVIPADHEEGTEDDELTETEERIELPGYRADWKVQEKERQLLLAVITRLYREMPDARVLVFVSTQSKSSAIAEYLKENVRKWSSDERFAGKIQDEAFLEALRSCDRDEGQDKLINELIPYGIAYHHAGLSTTLREQIEEQFSKVQSNLRVIVATETLTVGVNMPFDAMIMLSNMVPRGTGTMMPLTLQEYRNYIGRAGRLGQSNRIGKTYLFVEERNERERYWGSYYKREEVTSALTKSSEEVLAPYYLSLLNNGVKTADDMGTIDNQSTTFTLDQLRAWYDQSLSKICGNQRFDAQRLQKYLYHAYLASNAITGGARGRGVVQERYGIEAFGTHMAPFAFSINTCIKIYDYFFEGYRHDGMPLGVTQQDISSDRYLLDILYHICCHKEIAESSNLMYPMGDSNVTRSYNAKRRVLDQLRSILSETDESGELRYALWCDVNDHAEKENSDLWLLLNRTNLLDENIKLQAAMRTILLFYWTKGYSISRICKQTQFDTFSKVISGDIERLAEVASFHLDAIYKCLNSAIDPVSGRPVCQNADALKELYALHTRVKYGMPRDLVVLANKHIHGLDRKRLLELKKQAEKDGVTPLTYLYLSSPKKLGAVLTETQVMQLKQALERRGTVGSINTLMEIIGNDLAADSEELESLRAIANWSSGEEKETPDPKELYQSIKSFRGNPALSAVRISTDGGASNILWHTEAGDLRMGVLTSGSDERELLEFFREGEDALSRILVVPQSFSDEQMRAAMKRFGANALVDNVYLTYALGNAIRIPVDSGLALTEMLADLRGIFTKADYNHFPLRRYYSSSDPAVPKYRLLFGNSVNRRFDAIFSESDLEHALRTSEDLQELEVLPWGRKLVSGEFDFTECPTIVLLDRRDITRSESLTEFVNKMQNQDFRNCKLLLESSAAEEEWNSDETLEEYGNNTWNWKFNKIRKAVVSDLQAALREIRGFLARWEQPKYLIGISYAHYDSVPPEQISGYKNDVELLGLLAAKLADEFGEDRILFDRFDPAKKLFDANLGHDKALAAYETCRFYLVLWNIWTQENKNCREERDIILKRCRDNENCCMFLQTGHPRDPEVPEGYFQKRLSENSLTDIVERVKEMLDELLAKGGHHE